MEEYILTSFKYYATLLLLLLALPTRHTPITDSMFSTRGRKVLLSVHILLNSIWLGGIAIILLLNLSKIGVQNGDELYAINNSIFNLLDVVVINVAFGVIVTGLLFSLFTKWSFFDFYWVTIKWICLVALFVLIMFFLTPAINGMVAVSDVSRSEALTNPAYLHYQSSASLYSGLLLGLLMVLVALSVFKPGESERTCSRQNVGPFLL